MNASLLVSDKPLKIKIDKIDGSIAVLTLSDHQKIEISVKNLPADSKAGDYLFINLLTEKDLTASKKEIAKTILEEILSN